MLRTLHDISKEIVDSGTVKNLLIIYDTQTIININHVGTD